MTVLRSLWVWCAVIVLILFWLPFLAIIRVVDRDPARYSTGRWFRRLGSAMTRVNPAWKIRVTGLSGRTERRAMVVVSNHQSLADIPVISRLPWEMKWVAKRELFNLPVVGWMMRLAGDISLERGDARSGVRALAQASYYLKHNCPVMIFPEGTRSTDSLLGDFTDGAFHLAVTAGVPILPLAVEGTHNALPKKDWKFADTVLITVALLPQISTEGMTREDIPRLRDRVRTTICEAIARERGVSPQAVDRTARTLTAHPPG